MVILWYNWPLSSLTPKIRSLFSPQAATHFLVNKLREFGVRSRHQLVPDKFEYSHYLFARECMDIVGRGYMLITSGS